MLASPSRRWWTAPIVLLLGLTMILAVVALGANGQSADAATRPTCPPFVFTSDIDPAIALSDTGPVLDCIPPAFEGPDGQPEKHAVPLSPSDEQVP